MIWFEFQFENEHWTVYKEFIVSKSLPCTNTDMLAKEVLNCSTISNWHSYNPPRSQPSSRNSKLNVMLSAS